ncbi:VWA domain-containing protein [Pseudomonas sp. P66]|jgi:Ca-activated chloride channel family protein|uniref:VWA domain-containing protein n=1 Tax=Pseudomonas arcuscaelestis TaxID=2710591 RepID=A0ABS2BW99_9PSED|nr:VWA domain-containing protein [Pseudomonas arcuscaelestis]MBM3109799.1 VWA domain-containing protein [Pseudomonas arcuscaelestis]MBM5457750.1 VWA domain-containing protein [Pseudomonas arcuscaelestis]
MIELWPQWLRPAWLIVLPLLAWLLFKLWHRQKRAGRWQMILPPSFHAVLLGGGNGRDSKLPWIALGLAWLITVLALVGPSWQRLEETRQRPADPLVILLELTPQMLAEDVAPNRLEQARRKILDLLEHRRDSQTAIIVYAGSAHTLVPLSDDLATSRNLLEALTPSIMPQPGQRADLAVRKGLALLAQAGLGQGRLLLVGSSLSPQEREGINQALGRQGPSLLMLGIGTAQGAPVKQANGEFLKDDQGGILMPRLDSASLRAFVASTGGRYRNVRIDDLDLRGLRLFENPKSLRDDGQTLQLDSWADQGHWLLLPLLLLAACAGRRGWLFCLPLLLVLPQPSYAFEFSDLWLRPDQQGQRLLEQRRPNEAAQRFEDRQWKGLALYEAGDYDGAARLFAQGNSAADHFNRGNALARSGELEAALDAYEQALERQPELQAALSNKALVEQLLQQRQAEQPEQTPEQSQQSDPSAQTSTSSTQNNQDPASEQPSQQPSETSKDESNTSEQAQNVSGEGDDEETTRPPQRPLDSTLDAEQRQALEQWLRQIPDNPAELLRRKFWYEQQQHQESHR